MKLRKLGIPPKAKILEWSLVTSNFVIVLFLLILMLFMKMASPLYLLLELLFPVISIGILKRIKASVVFNIVVSFSLFIDFVLSLYFLLLSNSPTSIEIFSLVLSGLFISLLNLLFCVLNLAS